MLPYARAGPPPQLSEAIAHVIHITLRIDQITSDDCYQPGIVFKKFFPNANGYLPNLRLFSFDRVGSLNLHLHGYEHVLRDHSAS
jgi:hypothetical protein